ncbi:hypothetical protein FRB94_004817, partial [Tulasnella sp. JGI-2019a]
STQEPTQLLSAAMYHSAASCDHSITSGPGTNAGEQNGESLVHSKSPEKQGLSSGESPSYSDWNFQPPLAVAVIIAMPRQRYAPQSPDTDQVGEQNDQNMEPSYSPTESRIPEIVIGYTGSLSRIAGNGDQDTPPLVATA